MACGRGQQLKCMDIRYICVLRVCKRSRIISLLILLFNERWLGSFMRFCKEPMRQNNNLSLNSSEAIKFINVQFRVCLVVDWSNYLHGSYYKPTTTAEKCIVKSQTFKSISVIGHDNKQLLLLTE